MHGPFSLLGEAITYALADDLFIELEGPAANRDSKMVGKLEQERRTSSFWILDILLKSTLDIALYHR